MERRRILVTGATGTQGGAVARRLLERGHQVRALTRHADQVAAKALHQLGAEVVEGDLDDAASLEGALADMQGVFAMQNTWEAGPEAEIQQGKALADRAQRAGVEHFVQSSVASADRGTGIPHFDSKWEIEKHLRTLELPCTILRPVFFMQNWEHVRAAIFAGKLEQPLSPETRLQQIDVGDLAVFAALAFENPEEWVGRTLELAGDELAMRDVARTFTDITGVDVAYEQVAWPDFEKAMGSEMTTMFRWFEDTGYEADIDALRRLHPELNRLRAYLDLHGWARPEARPAVTAAGRDKANPVGHKSRLGRVDSLETPDPRDDSRDYLERGRR